MWRTDKVIEVRQRINHIIRLERIIKSKVDPYIQKKLDTEYQLPIYKSDTPYVRNKRRDVNCNSYKQMKRKTYNLSTRRSVTNRPQIEDQRKML